MRIWLALIAAPLLALADQSVSFATVGWACVHQHIGAVHAVHALFLLATVGATVLAWRTWVGMPQPARPEEMFARRHFLAGLATAAGGISAVAIIAMWIPAWVIPPCAI